MKNLKKELEDIRYVNIKITEKRGKTTRHQGAHVKPRKHDELKKPA
jgi:hypothetical protein